MPVTVTVTVTVTVRFFDRWSVSSAAMKYIRSTPSQRLLFLAPR